MMTTEQKNQILRYFQQISLAEDMQEEIFDHISLQIEDFMAKGLSFEEAFEQVKILWKKDFENVWLGFLRVPTIQKKRVKAIRNTLLIRAVVISLGWVFLLFGSVRGLNAHWFSEIYEALPFVFIGFIFTVFIGIMLFKKKKALPFRKNMISTEVLYSPVAGLMSLFYVKQRYTDGLSIFNGIHQNDWEMLLKYMLIDMAYYAFSIYLCLAVMRFYKDLKAFKLRAK